MTVLDSSLVRGAGGSDRLAGHDKILIVDFGSQVTQLIARRVREEKVYCEIVPFQKAEEAFRLRCFPTMVARQGFLANPVLATPRKPDTPGILRPAAIL